MKRLIVNADDLGIHSARSHGIFQAFQEGIVRSATLIANGSDAASAAKHARERNLPTGLHLNLTEGDPISKGGDVSTLLQGNGYFYDRHALRRLFSEDAIDAAHIEREIRAQVEWFLDHYGQPTHIDGHHHIHIHPFIVPLLIPILDRYGISCVRIPLEEPLPPFGYIISDDQLAHTKTLNEEARAARTLFMANGLRTTDHFRGLTLAGNASQKNFRHIMNKLPEGTTELMTHPSSMAAQGSDFDLDPQRQTELNMLCSDDSKEVLKERKIELISFLDL